MMGIVDSQKMTNDEVSYLIALFRDTREKTLELCKPLNRDDYMVQATSDTSPPKWHLGHTTWFFETFILEPYVTGYRRFDDNYRYLFNSYYETVGRFLPKSMRSTISCPSSIGICFVVRNMHHRLARINLPSPREGKIIEIVYRRLPESST